MSVPAHGVGVYDLGSQVAHIEAKFVDGGTPPWVWNTDNEWTTTGLGEFSTAARWLAVTNLLNNPQLSIEQTEDGVAAPDTYEIIAGLFHRHVGGEVVYSMIHRVAPSFERQVTVIGGSLYAAILRMVRLIPEDTRGNVFSTGGLPTDISWVLGLFPLATELTYEPGFSTADKTWTFGPRK